MSRLNRLIYAVYKTAKLLFVRFDTDIKDLGLNIKGYFKRLV